MDTSQDDGSSEGKDNMKLMASLKSYLPFLKTVIERQDLGIEPKHLDKLRSLYTMVDSKRLLIGLDLPCDFWMSTERLKSCQKVFFNLYSQYSKQVNKKDVVVNKSEPKKLIEKADKNKLPEVSLPLNKKNQNLSGQNELIKSPVLSTLKNKTLDNKEDAEKHLKQNQEPVIDKLTEKTKNCDVSSVSKLICGEDAKKHLKQNQEPVIDKLTEKTKNSDISSVSKLICGEDDKKHLKQNQEPVIDKLTEKTKNSDISSVSKLICGEDDKKHLKQNQEPVIDKLTEKTKNSDISSVSKLICGEDDKKHLQQNQVPVIDKCTDVSSVGKLLSKDSSVADKNLPEFSDSRIRLNKVIGFAANASIDKLNLSDTSVSQSELAKQIYEEINKHNKNSVICKQVLKDINMDDIDLCHVKNVIDCYKCPDINESDESEIPLSPVKSKKPCDKLVSSGESNDNLSCESTPISTLSEIQPDSSFIPNKSTSIREKLNGEINVIHKIGSSNDSKQKIISSLKPGTLIDLEKSKVIRSSLHIESLRPTIISNEKKSEPRQSVAEKVLCRDPRIKNRPLLNPENINPIQPIVHSIKPQLIPVTPITPNQCLNSVTSLLQPNINNSISTSFEGKTQDMTQLRCSSQQEVSGPNGSIIGVRNPTGQTNIQSPTKKFPTENNGNSNKSQLKNPPRLSMQDQFKQNDLPFDGHINNLGRYSNQIYAEPTSNNKTEVRYSKTPPASRISPKKHFRSYKDFREAKYGKQHSYKESLKKDFYRSNLARENDKLKGILKTDYKNLNLCNEGGIKAFKIPKINRREEIVDNILDKDLTIDSIEENTRTVMLENKKTNKNSKPVSIEGNSTQTDKDLVVDKIKEKNIETKDNNSIKDLNLTKENSLDIELKTNLNIGNDTNQELKAEKSQEFKHKILNTCDSRSINDNKTNQTLKPKKPKKYSKEKEFEKIVKEAVDESLNGKYYPRIRTRSSLKNKEETPIKSNLKDLNNSDTTVVDEINLVPEKFSNNIKNLKENPNESNLKDSKNLENSKNIKFEKCKIVDGKSDPTDNIDVDGSIETGQNIISSTSKEPSEVDDITGGCKMSEESVVSSNEINSTGDKVNNPKIEKKLINILTNPKLLSILRKNGKLSELAKLLESSDITVNEESTVSKKSKRKLLREERRKKKKLKKLKMRTVNENFSFEESKNETMNFNSNDDRLNKEENMKKTNKAGSSINVPSDHENSDSEIIHDHLSLDHGKTDSSKLKNFKEKSRLLKVQDNYCKSELKNLKLVISKLNMKESKDLNSEELTDDVQTNHNASDKRKQNIKSKKPFYGPLCVKLAKQKMEAKNNLHEFLESPQKNSQLELVTTNNSTEYERSNYGTSNPSSQLNKKLLVLIKPLDCYKDGSVSKVELKENHIEKDRVIDEPSASTTNPCQSNTIDNKLQSKKTRAKMTELDKLHADISENCAAVLNISNIRHCRKNKQIDYVNTCLLSPKKNKSSSSSEHFDFNDIEKSKKPCKKSTFNSNNKNYNTKNTLSHSTVKTKCDGKKFHLSHSGKLNKRKSKLSKKKQKQNIKKSLLRNVVDDDDQVNSEVTSQILSDNEFKDKLYFQTANNILKCKFCHYSDKGLNIVRHYKEQHIDEEVLPSRLSRNWAELLIGESLKNNFGSINYEQPEESETNKCVSFTCIFCQLIFDDFIKFYDHITGHTGEYRYRCKKCEKIYHSVNELEEHILIHSDYDKNDGISHLMILHNPVQSTNFFGYLCKFCNFIQLDYNNVVQHMTLRHSDEDEKCNGHWTVIRVNMSGRIENCTGSEINYKDLVGCLPPLPLNPETRKKILKDNEYRTEILQDSVKDIIAQTKQKLQVDPKSVKKEIYEPLDIIEDPPQSCLLSPIQPDKSNENTCLSDDPPVASHHLSTKLITQFNEQKCAVSEDPPKAGIHLSPIQNTQFNEKKCAVSEDPPKAGIHLSPIQNTQFNDKKCTASEDPPKAGIHLSPIQNTLSNENKCIASEDLPQSDIHPSPIQITLSNENKCTVSEDLPQSDIHPSPIQITLSNENKCTASEDLPQSDIHPSPIQITLFNENKCTASEDLPSSDFHPSPIQITQAIENKCTESEDLPQSDICLSPTPADESDENECTLIEEDPDIVYFKYTLKDKSKKCMVAGLSCELLNSVLLYKCAASKCRKIPFSTVVHTDFLKHVELEHQYLEWNRTCYVCNLKVQKPVDRYYLKDALEHLTVHHLVAKENLEDSTSHNLAAKETVEDSTSHNLAEKEIVEDSTSHNLVTKKKVDQSTSHHLVTKKNEGPDTLSIIDLTDEVSPSIQQKDTIQKNTIKERPQLFIRPRYLPGDILSCRDVSTRRGEKRNFNEDSRLFVLKDGCKGGIVGSIYCEQFNNMSLFKCIDKSCPIEFSTLSYKELRAHVELFHKMSHWNSMCNICGHGLWRNLFHLYMNNALEHLLSYHLVEFRFSENDTPPPKANNLVVANDSFPVDNMPSRSTNADCINDENMKETYEELTVDNSEQSDNIINNPIEISVDQTNNSKVSNSSLPVIVEVRSLKKNKKSMNSPKVSLSAEHSFNYDSNGSLSIGLLRKEISKNPDIYLEPGQQLINRGKPIFGTYCLIDADYEKSYFNQIRQTPLYSMKTKAAFNKIMTAPKLFGLYKCLDRCCSAVFNDKDLFKLHMKGHYSNIEKRKKIKNGNVHQFKKCIYCLKIFEDEESLAEHITDKYKYCKYFCCYCFYRAYTASHVLIHQLIVHAQLRHSILQLEYNNDEENDHNENSEEILKAVDFNNFVRPYRCNVGDCLFTCYVAMDFITHLNKKHQGCDKFCCYICADQDSGEGFFALQPKLMIPHFKLHSINMYQCIFCLFGTEIIDSMLSHLAMEHFEYEPLCLERSSASKDVDSSTVVNLKIIRIKKPVEGDLIEIVRLSPEASSLPENSTAKRKQIRSKQHSDVLSVAMKSACIDENNQPADTIVITVPDKGEMIGNNTSMEPNDSEFIILDEADQNNQTHETIKINSIWSENDSYQENPQESNSDVIIIDDEDDNDKSNDEDVNISQKRKRCEESVDQPKRIQKSDLLIVELDTLFTCNKCGKAFLNGNELLAHLSVCPFWNENGECSFCHKPFVSALSMVEHLELHGPKRFQCYLCSIYLPSQISITNHMKCSHNISDVEFTPETPELSDINKDNFIAFEKKSDSQQPKNKRYVHNYTCSECLFRGNTRHIIITHMRNAHHIKQVEITMDAVQRDKFTREFIVKSNESADDLMPPPRPLLTMTSKRKRSNIADHNKRFQKKNKISQDPKKCLLFDPYTIDEIPKSHIFSEQIGCSLCTYNTKVRSNLILHLNGHTKGQYNTTNKEIVNPVPSMGKSELMFDKMINLSASSFDAMNTAKNKNDEINKKIVEISLNSSLNVGTFPKFVPNNIRYKCSKPCTYTCITEDMLKTHMSILHPDSHWYICPHCPQNSSQTKIELNKIEFHLMHHSENLYKCQYCDYIDFNRNEMKTHMRNTHLNKITNEKQSNIIVVRQTVTEDIIIDRNKHQDVNIKTNQSTVAEWICKICTTSLKYTEQTIKSHIYVVHHLSNMFKCPMCHFEHDTDDARVFEQHYKLNHPSVAVKCLRVFEKITDEGIQLAQPEVPGNMLEQQALESIEPSLVPPTCRGIPVESVSNKPCAASKSSKPKSKMSPLHARKQKMLNDDVFNTNDDLGTISTVGQFVCPRCDDFETMNIETFREHLYKDVNYKTWKCIKCFEISDSPKKMAWHVKKHGNGSKYEKIEDIEKLQWVERVIKHQCYLFNELKKKHTENAKRNEEENKTVFPDRKSSSSALKKKNIECETKVVAPQLDCEIINLDDSDDE